jgi:hypothetical protein
MRYIVAFCSLRLLRTDLEEESNNVFDPARLSVTRDPAKRGWPVFTTEPSLDYASGSSILMPV